MRGAQWVDGRLVDPERPGICVHLVGTTPGFWCSECIATRPAAPPTFRVERFDHSWGGWRPVPLALDDDRPAEFTSRSAADRARRELQRATPAYQYRTTPARTCPNRVRTPPVPRFRPDPTLAWEAVKSNA